MVWHILFWRWLAHAAVGGLIVLGTGSLAARLCRQPVRRARLVLLTLIGGFLVPWVGMLPFAPRWSAARLPAVARARTEVRADIRAAAPAAASTNPVANLDRPAVRAETTGLTGIAPAVAGPGPSRASSIPWHVVAVAAYGAGAIGLAGWWLIGQALLLRISRAARPASGDVRDVFLAISGPAGRSVKLLESDRIALPFTFTRTRPVILLPSALCRDRDATAIRYVLAHEWSHVERRDARAWDLAALAGFVLFYHPLFWWLKRQLGLCQDYLADERAAALGSAEDYAAFLVRLRTAGFALPALGIGDRRSNLYRRIVMLVQDREPLEQRCRTTWSLAAALTASVAIVIAAGLRLDALEPQPAGEQNARAEREKNPRWIAVAVAKDGSLTYSGKVRDKVTGKPVARATVVVRRSVVSDMPPGDNRVISRAIGETRHAADAGGVYSFTIPREQVAEKGLYLEVNVEHPGYAPVPFTAHALSAIRMAEARGDRPFFAVIEANPGKPISGRILLPDRATANGVEILIFSRTDKETPGEVDLGSFTTTKTDKDGRFRATVATPGVGMVWIMPTDYAPASRVLAAGERGDLGTFTLNEGLRLKGRVVDVQGKPLAGLVVQADRSPDSPEAAAVSALRVGDALNRKARTDALGRFALDPLPPGSFLVQPVTFDSDLTEPRAPRPLPFVFTALKVTLTGGRPPEPVELKAASGLVIEGQWYDSNGKARGGYSCVIAIAGQTEDGAWWSDRVVPSPDGKFVIHVPAMMKFTQIDISTNARGALRHRVDKQGPLRCCRSIRFEQLDHDVKGLEIIHYIAPVVAVKATAGGGRPLEGLSVWADYTEPETGPPGEDKYILKGGVQSNVLFSEQQDGRFLSQSLQPGREVNITAQAPGFQPASRKLTLPEGGKQELTLVLEPR